MKYFYMYKQFPQSFCHFHLGPRSYYPQHILICMRKRIYHIKYHIIVTREAIEDMGKKLTLVADLSKIITFSI